MELNLKEHKAIVTGGSKGLGFAIANELASEGVHVAICSRSAEEVAEAASRLEKHGTTVFAQTADVTDPAQVKSFIAESADALGGVNILVNNAGRAHPGTFATLSDEDWHADLDVKLFSMIRCSREVLPYMRTAGGGRIINISAVHGKAPDPKFFATSTDRAACLAFSKTLALELAPENILVNSVNIGFVVTPQWSRIHEHRAPDLSKDEFFATLGKAEVPLGRFGEADEVSGIVTFLASDRASFITGASIDVAGGMGNYV